MAGVLDGLLPALERESNCYWIICQRKVIMSPFSQIEMSP
jgi:hypothetical protein